MLRAFEGTHPSAQRIKDMFICGFDGSGPVIKAIGTGGPIRATGALDAVAIGKASITAAANAIEGKSPTKINFPYVLCTYQTKAVNQKLLAELTLAAPGERDSRETPPVRAPASSGGQPHERTATRAVMARRRSPPAQELAQLAAAAGRGAGRRAVGRADPAVAVLQLATGSFFTRSNMLVVLEQVSVLGMVAVPGAMLLVSGNLDLSVGSVAGLAAACSASSTRSSAGPSGSPRWARSRSGRPGAR